MRGTYSLTRAEQWPRPMSYRLPVVRSGLLLAILFAVGVGLGLLASRPLAGADPQTVTEVDYVSIVAQLFVRDQNAGIARERLAMHGSPASLIDQAIRVSQSGGLKDDA